MTASSRRPLIWLCIAIAALLGVGAQLHGLSHALKAIHATTHDDLLAVQAQACDQCLQFAAVEGQAPAPAATQLPSSGGAAGTHPVTEAAARVAAFAAYESRAPPAAS